MLKGEEVIAVAVVTGVLVTIIACSVVFRRKVCGLFVTIRDRCKTGGRPETRHQMENDAVENLREHARMQGRAQAYFNNGFDADEADDIAGINTPGRDTPEGGSHGDDRLVGGTPGGGSSGSSGPVGGRSRVSGPGGGTPGGGSSGDSRPVGGRSRVSGPGGGTPGGGKFGASGPVGGRFRARRSRVSRPGGGTPGCGSSGGSSHVGGISRVNRPVGGTCGGGSFGASGPAGGRYRISALGGGTHGGGRTVGSRSGFNRSRSGFFGVFWRSFAAIRSGGGRSEGRRSEDGRPGDGWSGDGVGEIQHKRYNRDTARTEEITEDKNGVYVNVELRRKKPVPKKVSKKPVPSPRFTSLPLLKGGDIPQKIAGNMTDSTKLMLKESITDPVENNDNTMGSLRCIKGDGEQSPE